MSEQNELIQVVQNAIERHFEDVHTCLPGRVESYDFKTQKAQVKPLIKKVYLDSKVLALPVLGNVPVVFPRTQTSGITFPVNKGDKVALFFSERALERWYLSGEDSEPGDPRRNDLSDAFCVPGLFSFAESNLASNNSDVEIHHKDQKITIKSDGDIEIGTGPTLLSLVNETFLALFDSHTHLHPVGVPPPGPPLPPIPTGTPIPTSTAANLTGKVKAL